MDYPSNSNRDKARKDEPKVIESVVTGQVIRRKRSLSSRIGDIFIGGDAQSVWSYVAFDVLVPAAKDMLSDAVSQGVERMLFGDSTGRISSGRRNRSRDYSPGYTNYSKFSQPSSRGRGRESSGREFSRQARASHNFDEIILATRAEADEVLERMDDLIDKYGVVTVSDLYDLLDITSDFTDEKWGWSDIRSSSVRRDRRGYMLKLPRPEELTD
jgi:hypothetical protein